MMIMAAITPYLALGKATPLILLGLSSSLFLSVMFLLKKKGATIKWRPDFYIILPIGNIAFIVISSTSLLGLFGEFFTLRIAS